MPRNTSGVYTLPSGNPVIPGTVIDAAWANGTMQDMANEITNSLSRTGAGGMLAPFRLFDGTITAPGLSFLNETNTGLYRSGSGSAWMSVLGVNVAQFSTVGLTIPFGKALTAAGNASVGGTLAVTGATAIASTLAVTGAITAAGGVIGNVTGNVTAGSGSSSFNDVTINGSLDMVAGSSATITGLSTPTNASDAANKGYVDAQVTTRLALTGGTMTGAIAMSNNKVTGLATPTADQDAATKAYVDSVAQGLDVKGSCRAATVGNITLSGTQTIDGVAIGAGDRVLVKDQSSAAQNGIYVAAAGAWARAVDADTWTKLVGAFTFVEDGTVNDNSGWVCTSPPGGTLGVTAVTWEQFSGAGQITAGDGLYKSGNTINVGTASATRIVVNANDIDLATTGVTAGTYKSLTVDAYGRVTGGTNPTTLAGYGITDAYTQTQVNTALALKLNLTGGTMSGAIAMGANKITGLADPTLAQDAATKNYIDTIFGSTSSAAASAAAAASSASSASSSATAAASSATAAAGSATSAASSYTTFNNQYLGSKTSDPATNNTGGALVAGNLYWNSTASEMRAYNGTAWVQAYVPSSTYLPVAGGTMTGNLNFNGTGLRITGDFTTNTTVANRLMFQSSTANGNTLMSAIPNGTATTARWMVFNNSDPANSSQGSISALSTDIRLQSFNTGTGTLLPMTFYVGSSENGRISTAGNWLLGGTTDDGIGKLQVSGDATIYGVRVGRGANAISSNTAVGASALAVNTSGSGNAALGDRALAANTTGTNSVAVGQLSLYANTTGTTNVALGHGTLFTNTTGSNNTAVGDVALFSNTTASGNTALGYQASYTNTTGTNNTASGSQAMYYNTTGASNVAHGQGALFNNTTGNFNVGIGANALLSNTTANRNAAVGYQSLYTNSTGAENSALGHSSLYYNTTGNYNVAVGGGALQSNTTASDNTAIGYQSAYLNTTGTYNVAVGSGALRFNTTSSQNVAVGFQSLYLNTGANNTGLGHGTLNVNTTGASNVAVGSQALISNTTASNNTAVGYQAGYSGTTAADSTYLGFSAGYGVTTGTRNTLVGFYTGSAITTGTFNNFFGTQAGQAVTTGGKNTILGSYSGNQGGLDIRTSSNYIVLSDGDGNPKQIIDGANNVIFGGTTTTADLTNGGVILYPNAYGTGNSLIDIAHKSTAGSGTGFMRYYYNNGVIGSITQNGTSQVLFNVSSDQRLKENIQDAESASSLIDALQVRQFDWKSDGAHQRYGFVAQELVTVAPEAVYQPEDTEEMMAVDYSKLVPMLVKEIQSLRKRLADAGI